MNRHPELGIPKALRGAALASRTVVYGVITFETGVSIDRPLDEVFRFVADGRNAPRWNSAVKDVTKITAGDVAVGTEYRMVRDLPMGRVENTYRVVEYDPPERLTIQTLSGPTPFHYRYRFKSTEKGTRLGLAAQAELGGLAGLLGPLASSAVRRGVDANLQTLKRLLESGDPAD